MGSPFWLVFSGGGASNLLTGLSGVKEIGKERGETFAALREFS
jgi:hypothetical protein